MPIILRPLGSRVVISPVEPQSQTPGGIVLPDMAKEKPTRGKVLSVGPGRLLDSGERAEMEVADGDTVLYPRYEGTTVEVDGDELVVMEAEKLLAKMEG